MAQHTRLSVAAPPAAPPRESTRQLLLRGYAAVVLIVALAPTAWVNLLGVTGTTVLVSAVIAATVAIGVRHLVRTRRTSPFPWRRLPWSALVYVCLAVLSIGWSAWPMTSGLTAALLVVVTVHGLLIASWLSWREILGALGAALKWIIGASLLFELWVSLILREPVLPNGVPRSWREPEEWMYWSQENLFTDERIQGIVGNANLFAALCLLGLIVFSIQLAVTVSHRAWLIGWLVLTGLLFIRAGSATAFLAAAGLAVVALAAILVRRARDDRTKRRIYLGIFTLGPALLIAAWALRGAILELLDRSSDLTGREQIWDEVFVRAEQRPWLGWGHASPWIPWDPAFRTWIVEPGGRIVQQAHNVWVDVFFQLGVIGALVFFVAMFAFVWRTWFFAVDRPRWDLDARRPYSPIALLPVLVAGVLVVQGFTESSPMMLWGWMLLVLFSFKIKIVPVVAGELDEQTVIDDQRP